MIVGVVGDIHHWSLDRAPGPEIYVPHAQDPTGGVNLAVRTAGDPLALATGVRAAVGALDPDQPVYSVEPLVTMLERSYFSNTMAMSLMSAFAGMALALAMIGLAGLMAYTISQRTREVGVRMALGAQRGDVLRLMLGQGMRLVLIGVTIGLVMALGAAQFMRGLLFGVGPADPATFATAAGALCGVGLLACWIPARRATKVDPMVALRYE